MSDCNEFLGFVNKVFDAWAWPLIVLAIFWWVKDHVAALLPNVESLAFGGLEAKFRAGVREAEAEAAHSGIPGVEDDGEQSTAKPEFIDPDAHPIGVVMVSWHVLESTARELVERRGRGLASKSTVATALDIGKILRLLGLWGSGEYEVYEKLRKLWRVERCITLLPVSH